MSFSFFTYVHTPQVNSKSPQVPQAHVQKPCPRNERLLGDACSRGRVPCCQRGVTERWASATAHLAWCVVRTAGAGRPPGRVTAQPIFLKYYLNSAFESVCVCVSVGPHSIAVKLCSAVPEAVGGR